MLIQNHFTYTPISRKTIEGKRHYCLPDGSKVASVTSILDATKSKESVEALQNWRKRVGFQNAQTITTEAAGVGTAMHKILENYCLGMSKPPGTNKVHTIARPMAQEIILKGLSHLDECWGTEIPVFYPEIYAGTTDLAGIWKKKESILDFKQTNRPKKSEWVDDYRIQLAAYAEAHNKIHGTNIRRGVILMCSRNCEYQEFVIEGKEFDYWVGRWWDRVETYYKAQT